MIAEFTKDAGGRIYFIDPDGIPKFCGRIRFRKGEKVAINLPSFPNVGRTTELIFEYNEECSVSVEVAASSVKVS